MKSYTLIFLALILSSCLIGCANAVTPTPTFNPSTRETETLTFYMRSDTYTTLDVSGYGFDTDYTDDSQTLSVEVAGAVNVSYGFRAYTFTSDTVETELTVGSPTAILRVYGNFTGQLSSSWVCPETVTTLGYEAIKVVVYISTNNETSWTALATYVSDVVMTNKIVSALWNFQLNIQVTQLANTTASFMFGNTDYRSAISNVVFEKPFDSEVQWYRLSNADLVGFVIGGYADKIGEEAVYVLLLFAVCGAMYRRYNHFGPVAFWFILFAGPGGLLIALVPSWAVLPSAIFLILGCVFILWRLIR
jgi:hypothetical protein